MKETQFIQQNKEKWLEFEQILNETNKDPDKLHDVFIQITDDLSHARTFYPARSVRAYLNGVAQLIFTDIYKQKKSPLSKIRTFFTDDLPQVIYESRWSFFWAVAFFLLSFAIGYFSSIKDPDFIKTILGDSYVEMTLENIKSGDPMAVYKKSGRFDMTFGIMENNMRVTLMYFIFGVFAGIGSVAMMMYNGIMVGAFLQFFSQNNLLKEANLTIWMHGTLEISAIVIGTAAGITMGRGLLFPGTYSRLQAFQMSARKGIKIIVGVMVMLFFAALIEGNLTRHTELGDIARGAFIATNLALVLFYYGWYPFYKAKKGFFHGNPSAKKALQQARLPPDNLYNLDFNKIKNAGEIFADTFAFFKQNMKTYFWISVAAALFFCGVIFGLAQNSPEDIFQLQANIFNQTQVILQFFANNNATILPYLNGFIMAIMIFMVYRLMMHRENRVIKTRNQDVVSFLKIYAVSTALMWIVATSGWWVFMFFFILMPFFALWSFLMYRNGFGILTGVQHTWWLMGSGVTLTYATHYIMQVLGFLFFTALSSGFLYLYLMFIGWNLSFVSQAHFDNLIVIMMAFIASFTIFINFMLFFTAYGFLYYSLLEVNEANSLLNKIQKIGAGRKIQGLARE